MIDVAARRSGTTAARITRAAFFLQGETDMPKPTITPSPVAVDMRALALTGARLELQRIIAERARILATFPELSTSQRARLDANADALRAVAGTVAAVAQTHTCEICGAGFTPEPKHAHRQRVCGKAACTREIRQRGQREYRERIARENGAAS